MKDFVTPNKSKHQYIIGIDFGHGETSADICNIQWDDNYLSLSAPEPIEIFNGQHATKSALLIEYGLDINNCKTLNYYVGEQAIERYGNRHRQQSAYKISQFYSYFKNIPSLMDETEKNVMKCFMRGIYQQIRNQRSELTDDNHVVYIACPSNATKWTNEEMKKYAEIALEAGLPLAKIGPNNIGIIRESRAAFIKARSNPNSKTSVKEGILLIDFGSSTVDLTYYSSSLKTPEDGGNDCGAQHVEKYILNRLKEDSNLAATCSRIDFGESAMLLEIRVAKENYYKSKSQELEIDIKARKVTGGQIVSGSIEAYYSQEDIEKLLLQYKKDLLKGFEEFRDKHLKSHPIRLVYMTGGASRMEFIKDIVREAFNYKGDFYREPNPSLTISNGIALAGRADLRSHSLLQALWNHKNVNEAAFADKVIKSCVEDITEIALSEISKVYDSFRDGNFTQIKTLENRVKSSVASIAYASIVTEAYARNLIDEVNNVVLPKLNGIVGDYFPDGKIALISSNRQLSTNITISDTLRDCISSSMNAIAEGFFMATAKFIVNILGGILAVLGAGVEKIGRVVVDFFTDKNTNKKSYDELVDEYLEEVIWKWKDENTYLNTNQREKVYADFQAKRRDYQKDIKLKIERHFQADSDFKNKVNDFFKVEVKEYIKEQVNLVRLMLN